MIDTKEVMLLIEANQIMSRLIGKLYDALLQVATVEEVERMGVLPDMSRACEIMGDYETGGFEDG